MNAKDLHIETETQPTKGEKMKTDKEKLLELLKEWGVECEVGQDIVKVERGYLGFYTHFAFEKESGKFVDMGAYE